MTFRPGVSGNPSGRPKKLLKRVDEVLHERGLHPVEEVLALLTDPTARLSPMQRIDVWLDLLPYVAPRLKEAPEDPPGEDLGALKAPELVARLDQARKELRRELQRQAKGRKAG